MPRLQIKADDQLVVEGSTPIVRFQVKDQQERPVSKSIVVAMTLTYKNIVTPTSPTVINTRSAQDILDTNDGVFRADLSVSSITQANPCVVTTTTLHRLFTGDRVYFTSVGGMTELNSRTFEIVRVSDTSFELARENSTSHTAYTSGGSIYAGLVEWNMTTSDSVIDDTDETSYGESEPHNAHFAITYNTDQVATVDVPIDVRRNY